MNRIFLRATNAPGIILIVVLAVALQTSLFRSYPIHYFQPDVVLLATIWLALRRDFTEGGILTLVCAYVAGIHSSAVQGVYLMTYMPIYLAIRWLSRYFMFVRMPSIIGLTAISSIVVGLESLLLGYLLDYSPNQWRHVVALLFPGAFFDSLLGFMAYRGLEKFDLLTHKDPRARQALADEMILEEEGL